MASLIRLDAVLVGEFEGLSWAHARRLIRTGHVELNGQVVTELEVDLDTIHGDPVNIRVARDMTTETLILLLETHRDLIDRESVDDPQAH